MSHGFWYDVLVKLVGNLLTIPLLLAIWWAWRRWLRPRSRERVERR